MNISSVPRSSVCDQASERPIQMSRIFEWRNFERETWRKHSNQLINWYLFNDLGNRTWMSSALITGGWSESTFPHKIVPQCFHNSRTSYSDSSGWLSIQGSVVSMIGHILSISMPCPVLTITLLFRRSYTPVLTVKLVGTGTRWDGSTKTQGLGKGFFWGESSLWRDHIPRLVPCLPYKFSCGRGMRSETAL